MNRILKPLVKHKNITGLLLVPIVKIQHTCMILNSEIFTLYGFMLSF